MITSSPAAVICSFVILESGDSPSNNSKVYKAISSLNYKNFWALTGTPIENKPTDIINLIKIVNPISSELGVLRNSIFSNLIFYLSKNLDRGFKDVSLFEIGPVFFGSEPGQQETVIGGLNAGKKSRLSWIEKSRKRHGPRNASSQF